MLPTLALALALVVPTPRHTVEANVLGWSTASFRLRVNGAEIAHVTQRTKLDLDPHLREGRNEVEVRYETRDGKISRLHPATLRLERREGERKSIPIRVVASEDNPRGKVKATLIVPSR